MSLRTSSPLGDLCAVCGMPLRPNQQACPRCGHRPGESPQAHLMTPFGYGFCGMIVGAQVALLLLRLDPPPFGRYRMLAVFLLAALVATLASQLGKRLAPEVRGSYEHLLMALMFSGLLTIAVAYLATLPWAFSAGLWLILTAKAFVLLRRFGYGGGGRSQNP